MKAALIMIKSVPGIQVVGSTLNPLFFPLSLFFTLTLLSECLEQANDDYNNYKQLQGNSI